MVEQNKEIEKPRAVYSHNLFSGIGEVIQEWPDGYVMLKYSENQHFSPQGWKPNFIRRFSTAKAALEYRLIFETDSFLKKKLTTSFYQEFPTAMKQEAVQTLHDTLIVYKNAKLSQSQPKCTE
jgi:hypothetical protein